MAEKTLRKCSGCHTLIEVCAKTPGTVKRFCTSCMAQKLSEGCTVCGIHKDERRNLVWFKGEFRCSYHLNHGYKKERPQPYQSSNLGMVIA